MAAAAVSTSVLLRHAADAMVTLLRHAPRFEARLWRDAWLVLSGEPAPLLNWLAVAEWTPSTSGRVRELVAVARQRNVPALLLAVDDDRQRISELSGELALAMAGKTPLMLCGRAEARFYGTQNNVEIRRVAGHDDLGVAREIFAAALGFPLDALSLSLPMDVLTEPGLRFTLASVGGKPASAVATWQSGSLVYIVVMATSPDEQGKGIGRALLERVMAEHIEQGAEHFSLVASEAGRRLYTRIGFRTIAELSEYEVF